MSAASLVQISVDTPFKANMVLAYDFVFDTTAGGQPRKSDWREQKGLWMVPHSNEKVETTPENQ